MHQENLPDDTGARPGFAVDPEALRRDLRCQLVETSSYVAYSIDVPHHAIGRSEEEALEALRRRAPTPGTSGVPE